MKKQLKEHKQFIDKQIAKEVTGKYRHLQRIYISYNSNVEHYEKNVLFSEMIYGDKSRTHICSFLLDCINIAFKLHQKISDFNGFLNNINKLNILLGDMLYVICYKKCFDIDEFECFTLANRYIKEKYENSIIYEQYIINTLDGYVDYSKYQKGDLNILSCRVAYLLTKPQQSISDTSIYELGKNIGLLELIINDLTDLALVNKKEIPCNNLFFVLSRRYNEEEQHTSFGIKKSKYKEYKKQMQYVINNILNDCTELFDSTFDDALQFIYALNVDTIEPILTYTQNLKSAYMKEVNHLLDYDNLIYNKLI